MKHIFIKIKPIEEDLLGRPSELYINVQHIIWVRIIDNSDKFVGIQISDNMSENHHIISYGDWKIIEKKMEKTCSILDAVAPPKNPEKEFLASKEDKIRTPYIKAIYTRKPYEKESTLTYRVFNNSVIKIDCNEYNSKHRDDFKTKEEAQNYLNKLQGKNNEN